MNILDTTISHIVSQLSYKSIKIRGPWESASSDEITQIPLRHWEAYLEDGKYFRDCPWSKFFLEKLSGVSSIVLRELEILMNSARLGIHYLSICDPRYPYLLRHIEDPPLGIFYLGNLALLEKPSLGIVGARKAASDAIHETQRLAELLANEGAAVVSGGAMGIDTAAHLGTLMSRERESPAISVQAGSLERLYPKCNDYLFRRILSSGGLFLSERLLGSQPRPYDFPVRNRIISGLSNRILVMQASLRSGAISTPR